MKAGNTAELNVQNKIALNLRGFKDFFIGILYLLPSLLLLGIFIFYPMIKTFYLSVFLTDQQGNPAAYVGLENYRYLLTDPGFLHSFKATVLFVLYTVPSSIIIALFLALLTNEKLKGIGLFRTLFSSTMGISVAASSVIWLFLFNPSIGMLNQILTMFHLPTFHWLQDPDSAIIAVSITTVWMNIGFAYLILLGGLQNIPADLYEQANVTGTGYWYQLFKITIPMLSPTLFFISTVTLINAFQTFGQIDILTKGGPSNATNLIVYSIYQDAFVNYRLGEASAQVVLLFFCMIFITFIQFKLGEKKVHYQ
ncbi:carbohydrate ABC transporter permease [Falsibacillus albus]|uniref:Sugar ABC transporter permease n=1 Tax=Falsibacillus albus TaxID=2478915 RepID=A0A3L7JT45_9BACI|nr:sugar ABC transporter permease [Falsibacillus albus]RLQ94037.1 sugar ABC transporter permease [Falsibacillus albus]